MFPKVAKSPPGTSWDVLSPAKRLSLLLKPALAKAFELLFKSASAKVFELLFNPAFVKLFEEIDIKPPLRKNPSPKSITNVNVLISPTKPLKLLRFFRHRAF